MCDCYFSEIKRSLLNLGMFTHSYESLNITAVKKLKKLLLLQFFYINILQRFYRTFHRNKYIITTTKSQKTYCNIRIAMLAIR
jgi:hypothetical protein